MTIAMVRGKVAISMAVAHEHGGLLILVQSISQEALFRLIPRCSKLQGGRGSLTIENPRVIVGELRGAAGGRLTGVLNRHDDRRLAT